MKAFFLLAGLLAGGMASALHANTVNFDSFVDATNINGVNLGGVTVTNSSGHVDVYSNRFGVGSRSGTNAIGSFAGSSSISPMVFTFDAAVSFVELFAGDFGGPTGDLDQWSMSVFDAVTGGNLLATLTSAIWHGSPYQGLSYTGNGVMRIEANWIAAGCCGIGFDDLTFTPGSGTGGGGGGGTGGGPSPVPLPAGGALLMAALGGFGYLRRKRSI